MTQIEETTTTAQDMSKEVGKDAMTEKLQDESSYTEHSIFFHLIQEKGISLTLEEMQSKKTRHSQFKFTATNY